MENCVAKAWGNSFHMSLEQRLLRDNDSRLLRRHGNDNLALCRISNVFRMTKNVDLFQPFLKSAWRIFTFKALCGFASTKILVWSGCIPPQNTFRGDVSFLEKDMKLKLNDPMSGEMINPFEAETFSENLSLCTNAFRWPRGPERFRHSQCARFRAYPFFSGMS